MESVVRHAERLAYDGRWSEALAALEGEPDTPEVRFVRVLVDHLRGRHADADAGAEALLALGDAVPASICAQLWCFRADARRVAGEDARLLVAHAQGFAEASGDPVAFARCCLSLAAVSHVDRDHAKGQEYGQAAVIWARRIAEPEIRACLSILAAHVLEGRREVLEAAALAADEAGSDYLRAIARMLGMRTASPADDEVEALARVFEDRGAREDLFTLWWQRGRHLHDGGDLARAEACYARATAVAEGTQSDWLDLARAILALQRGAAATALARTEALLAAAPRDRTLRAVAHTLRAALAADPVADLRVAWRLLPTVAPNRFDELALEAVVDRLERSDLDPALATRTRAVALSRRHTALAERQAEHVAAGAPIPLGGFDLHARLGAGGMGEVWRATYVEGTTREWAVKLVLPDRLGSAGAVRDFERETRAVASLSHPHVVPVVDLGTTPPSRVTGGALPEGAPWYAMPLAAGSFAPLRARLSWEDLQRMLLGTLSALAHAHAHGLFHLDVKPENVLFLDRLDPAGSLVLADFGQARRPGERGGGGTPAYMPPEQFRGTGLGPWSDLYAVGAMAVTLATGTAPFGLASFAELRRAHASADPPPLAARMPVPEEFEGWTRWLLEKDPALRPPSAAAAAAGLRALGAPVAAPAPSPRPSRTAVTVPFTIVGELPVEAEVVSSAPGAPATGLAFPRDWRSFEGRPRSLPPSPALLGLRRPVLVGREAVRDRLWSLLRDVVVDGISRAVVLAGPRGAGTSRLAEWIGRAALEAGVAQLVHDLPGRSREPLVWWVDDPGRADLGALRQRLVDGGPILVVVAAHPEDLTPELGALGPCIDIGPLDPATTEALYRSLVTLRASARETLADAAGGNPGYAVELLAACAAVLIPSDSGWTLPDHWAPPARLGSWEERLRGLDATPSLELAAALGASFAAARWAEAAAEAGLPDPTDRVAAWIDAGWIRPSGDRLELAHPDLRSALVASAQGERWARWNRACAAGATGAERARHLLEAGAPAEALRCFLDAMRDPRAIARADLAAARRAAALAGVREGDGTWRELAAREGAVLRQLADAPGLVEHSDRVLATFARRGEPPPPVFLLHAGWAAWLTGRTELALERLSAAGAGEGPEARVATLEHGRLLLELGRTEEALAHCTSAREHAAGEDRAQLDVVIGLALRDAGRLAEARQVLSRVRDVPAGSLRIAMQALGDVLRWTGDPDGAERAYERGRVAVGGVLARPAVHETNLLLVAIARGDVEGVAARLPSCRPRRDQREAPAVSAVLGLAGLLLPSESSWTARIGVVGRALAAVGRAEPDVRWTAGRVADLLAARAAPAEVTDWLRQVASRG